MGVKKDEYLEQHMVITGGGGRQWCCRGGGGIASRPSVSAASYVLGGLGTCIELVVLVLLVEQPLEDAVPAARRLLLLRVGGARRVGQQVAQLGRVLGGG